MKEQQPNTKTSEKTREDDIFGALSRSTAVTSTPKAEDLELCEREVHFFETLWQAHRNSERSPIVLGQPLPEL